MNETLSFHSEFYGTFLNFNISVGTNVILNTDQNFRTVKHPRQVEITKPGNFQMLVLPSQQADELLELEVNLPNETYQRTLKDHKRPLQLL